MNITMLLPIRLPVALLASVVAVSLVARAEPQQPQTRQPDAQTSRRPHSNHDDPVVVDNERISITRAAQPKDPKGSDRYWSLHEMEPFTHVRVTSKPKMKESRSLGPIKLDREVSTFRFDVLEEGQTASDVNFTVSLDLPKEGAEALDGHKQIFVASSDDRLQFYASGKSVRDKNKSLHIGQISSAGFSVCLARTGWPEVGPCGSDWAVLPETVKVELCANSDCRVNGGQRP
jgi:hypothetical protein